MKQFSLELYSTIQRPVIYLPHWHKFDAMLDTGALFPVWVDDESILSDLGATCVSENVEFGGIGGNVNGKMYKLPYLKLGELIYPQLPVVAHSMNVPCNILLSATMFSNLRYEIDDENHMLNITIPDVQSCVRNMFIRNEKGHLQVLCVSGDESTITDYL